MWTTRSPHSQELSIYRDIWLNSTRQFIAQHKKGFLKKKEIEKKMNNGRYTAKCTYKIFLSTWIMDIKLSKWFTSQNVNICCQTPDERIAIFHNQ